MSLCLKCTQFQIIWQKTNDVFGLFIEKNKSKIYIDKMDRKKDNVRLGKTFIHMRFLLTHEI